MHFAVPAGKQRLNASITFQAVSATYLDSRVRLTLVDPRGRLAAYSVPQGDGNYGDVQVTRPTAGQWTAYIYSRDSADGGTTGPVVFGAGVANWERFGSVSPLTETLAPGSSGTFTVTAKTPTAPGDRAASLLLRSAVGGVTVGTSAVPIVVRSVIPAGPTSFTGTLTGGNGRGSTTGQAAYYQIAVPAGRPELNVSITLARNANNPFTAELVDPSGQAVSLASNARVVETEIGPVGIPSLGAELHALSPAGGMWALVVDFYGQVSGTALSQRYTVTLDENAVVTGSTGLPKAASTVLPAGKAVAATVTVHNTGTAPELYFVDARLDKPTTITLAPFGGDGTTEVPGSSGVDYVVPTDTTSLSWSATSTVPLLSELTFNWGDPDLLGAVTGRSASGSFAPAAQPVAQGPWDLIPQELGPDGANGGPSATVTTAVHATTAAFDPAVTSATGTCGMSARIRLPPSTRSWWRRASRPRSRSPSRRAPRSAAPSPGRSTSTTPSWRRWGSWRRAPARSRRCPIATPWGAEARRFQAGSSSGQEQLAGQGGRQARLGGDGIMEGPQVAPALCEPGADPGAPRSRGSR